jgi:hypothetical protein
MPTKLKYLPFLSLVALGLAGCHEDSQPSQPLSIERLDQCVVSSARFDSLMQVGFTALMEINGVEVNAQNLDSVRRAYVDSRAVQVFQADIERYLPPLDSVEQVLGHAAEAYSAGTVGTVFGMVSPYSQSVITVGENVFVGLNHYLGEDYPGYAGRFPQYMLQRKTLAKLPTDVMQAVVVRDNPPQFTQNPTLLSRMLYDGAVTHCVLATMPAETTIGAVLGFSAEQIHWCEENEARIWMTIIEQNLLYSTDPLVADKLLKPSPVSTLINGNAPGETARWVAWRIVQAYVERHPDANSSALLSPSFYNENQSLIDSQYSPYGKR